MNYQSFKQTALSSCDSYKLGHADQYPEGTTKVYSNFTPRANAYFNAPKEYKENNFIWFGLQAWLMELNSVFQETFFDKYRAEVVNEAKELYFPFVGPKGFDTSRIEALWELGYLPLSIKALPEGTKVPIGTPVLTITNTHPNFAWLPNFLETWISSELWKMSTSANTAYVYKKIITKYAELTGGSKEFIQWQAHDFSVRGMSGIVDAAKSGAGHLLFSTGTDNLPAVKLVNDCYGGKNTFVGGSVPATEHSVMCAGGKENEVETFRRLIKTYPNGIVSIVSDSWDFWNVITNTAVELKQEILNRGTDEFGNSKVVFRPDSGDPVEIICGKYIPECKVLFLDCHVVLAYCVAEVVEALFGCEATHGEHGASEVIDLVKWNSKLYRYTVEIDWNRHDKRYYYTDGSRCTKLAEVELTPEEKGAVECLAETFGTTTNEKGYKTLNSKVGLIYGDSITFDRADKILRRLAAKGFASDNVVFGVGSFTYQYQTRDTFGLAMKATYVEIDGVGQAIFKEPKTDSGTKKSARGLLMVDENLQLHMDVTPDVEKQGMLREVYRDGKILVLEEFDVIRQRANA